MYLNIDINSVVTPFLNQASENPSREALYPFVDLYRGTQVTDILFDIFCQYSAADTAYWSTYADKYLQTTENGVAVDYKELYRGIYTFNKTCGIDPYAVWIDRCRRIGVRPWITVRMNDTHCPELDACFLRSDFYYEAKEKGWILGDKYGYYRITYNYAVPEVRGKMLGYIAEQLDRYDTDGLELDFMREPTCFRYLDDDMAACTAIMNDFVRAVRTLVREAETKRGHAIRLGVRLPRSIEDANFFGFDPVTWAREGIVDLIVPTPRWAASDSGIDVSAWKAALPGVEVSVGLETLAQRSYGEAAFVDAAMARGIAASYMEQGADGVYLFNFFGQELADRDHEIRSTCASPETIWAHPVRFPIISEGNESFEGHPPTWLPLPAQAGEEGASFTIRTGAIPQGKHTQLVIGVAGERIGLRLSEIQACVNGVACDWLAPVTLDDGLTSADGIALCGRVAYTGPEARIEVRATGAPVTVEWVEIVVV